MTINWCAPCSDQCIRNIISSDKGAFQRAVYEILCSIAGAVGGGSNVVNLAQVQITAATLQSTYGTYHNPAFLDATKKLNTLWVTNNTDSDIDISLDGGVTTAFTVFANASRLIDVGNYTGAATSSFQLKRGNSMSAGTGILYLEGTYVV